MDEKETPDVTTSAAEAGETSPGTMRYFIGENVLFRRQSPDHWPEIYREKTKTWDPYRDMFKFDHSADECSEEEAKAWMAEG